MSPTEDEAKHLVDKEGGVGGLERKAGKLKDIAEGGGSVVDKAEQAAKEVAANRP